VDFFGTCYGRLSSCNKITGVENLPQPLFLEEWLPTFNGPFPWFELFEINFTKTKLLLVLGYFQLNYRYIGEMMFYTRLLRSKNFQVESNYKNCINTVSVKGLNLTKFERGFSEPKSCLKRIFCQNISLKMSKKKFATTKFRDGGSRYKGIYGLATESSSKTFCNEE